MPVFDLAKILEEIHCEDYEVFDNPSHYESSPDFKRKMQERLDGELVDDSGGDDKTQS